MILQRPKAQEDGEFGDIHSLQVSLLKQEYVPQAN